METKEEIQEANKHKPVKNCKYCGRIAGVWLELDLGLWRLVDLETGEVHTCKEV